MPHSMPDDGRVKMSTFDPLKTRQRGASKVVVRPDGRMDRSRHRAL